MKKTFDSIEAVIDDIAKGRMVVVVDDADRENEGDLIMAAERVTPVAINFMARFGRGLICVPTTSERLKQLGVEEMVTQNRESFKTDFQVTRPLPSWRNRPQCRKTSCSPGMFSRCAHVRVECCNEPATLRRRSIWRAWLGAGRLQ